MTHPPAPSREVSRPSPAKLWGFRLAAATLVPLAVLGGLEASLRLIGVGYPTAALIERRFEGQSLCTPNARFGWRFFPRQMARGFDDSLTFQARKPPETFRVFVLGGSAARGTPDQAYGFGRLLEAMLGERFPDRRVEVLNAAMTAINSHVVREIAADCSRYAPDLVVVFMGNNEVVGPYGPGTVLTASSLPLPLIRATIAAKTSRLGQVMEGLLEPLSSRPPSAKQWGGMAMFLDKQVPVDSPALEPVYHAFKRNLTDICRIARGAGASVIVSTVPVNLRDCPPFASRHRSGLSDGARQAWQTAYDEGVALEDSSQAEQAVDRYRTAAEIDDSFADLQFRLGRTCLATGDEEQARLHFRRAMDLDTLRFRADTRINDIIRTTVSDLGDEGTRLVDAVAAFDAESPHGIPGTELFYEHVHPTFRGNCLLARSILAAVEPLFEPAADRDATLDDEAIAQRVAYTAFDEYTDLNTMAEEYVSKPPFTNQIDHASAIQNLTTAVAKRRAAIDPYECLRRYDRAIIEHSDDWRLLFKHYQLLFAVKGDTDLESLEAILRRIVAVHPYDKAYHTLGNILMLQRRYPEAEQSLRQSLALNPASGPTQYSLAVLCLKRDDPAGAIRHLERSIAMEPAESIPPYRLLATQYDNAGNTDRAITVLDRAIDVFPDDKTALVHCHVGELLTKRGRHEAALKHLDAAVTIDPALAANPTFVTQYNLARKGTAIISTTDRPAR